LKLRLASVRLGLGVAVVLGLCACAVFLRKTAGGLRNALSPAYWRARENGADLYEPSNHLFKRGPRDRAEVALSFDDGPHPKSLPLILAALRASHVHATFFMVGSQIALHPSLARAVLADGNEVGNHTYDHKPLDKLSVEGVRHELNACENTFHAATGAKMDLMRPPGMRFDPKVLQIASQLGYVTVDWNVAAKDYMTHIDPNVIASRVLSRVQDGSIILLHDDPDTAAALPYILEELRQRGLQAVMVSQMLAALPKPVLVATNANETKQGLAVAVHRVNRASSFGPAHSESFTR